MTIMIMMMMHFVRNYTK